MDMNNKQPNVEKDTKSGDSIYSKKEANYNAERSVEEIVEEFLKEFGIVLKKIDQLFATKETGLITPAFEDWLT
jgi:3-oxoacyl-[acyl-carrier-protein] synthase III